MLKNIIAEKRRESERKVKKLANKRLATGAGIGILVGSIAGILLAPKSGKETRESLASSAKDLNDNVKAKAVETKTTLSTKSKEAKCKISDYLNEKKKSLKETTNEIVSDNNSEDIEEIKSENDQ